MEQPLNNNQQPSPEKMEDFYISQLSQAVAQDTAIVQQYFQKYQNSATLFSIFGIMNTADPRIWHVNHLFQSRHYLEGYNNVQAFLVSQGLTRFSDYLNLVKADIHQALVNYGAVPYQNQVVQQTAPSNYLQKMMDIQKDATDYATQTQLDINKKWQDTFDKTNQNWSDNF